MACSRFQVHPRRGDPLHKCGLATCPARTLMPTHAPREGLMKRTSIIAALVLSAVSSTIAQQQSARTRDAASTGQAVQQQDQERIRAQIAAATIALRRIYADDFLGIGPTGVVRNKAEVIADFRSHALTYNSITTTEVR